MREDTAFMLALRRAVADDIAHALAEPVVPDEKHRRLMERTKLFVGAYVWSSSERAGDAALVRAAHDNVRALRALQGDSGLFVGGDNVDSPPDSSFTVNDLCDTLQIIRSTHAEDAGLAALADDLEVIADAVQPALLRGGVHTPNHRWEISAALARLHRRRASPDLRARAEQWLAEGIDITADGIFSERSANYAAFVSNPSLSVIADVFDRDDARRAVIRNLESTLGLIHPDGSVETVHSRRQDQLHRFSIAAYLVAYRRYAIEGHRGDFAWAAERALGAGIVHASSVLGEMLLDPQLGGPLPDAEQPRRQEEWAQSSLAVDDTAHRRLVVFGGTDYPRFRRIRSGLSTNPTFLRMFAGEAVLDSVRLSRDFFGLGPFRAEGLQARTDADGVTTFGLTETVGAAYYQPLEADRRDPSGEYRLTDDGRFYGSMSFPERLRDEVVLATTLEIAASADGAILEISLDGPDCAWALELAFGPGGRFEGVTPLHDDAALLTEGTGRYLVGGSAIAVSVAGDTAVGPARYLPGEDYGFLGATDALTGPRLYVTGRSPGRAAVELRAESVAIGR